MLLGVPFQSPDGDFVYSDTGIIWTQDLQLEGFNPLTGISSILTGYPRRRKEVDVSSFNPLTGISSILTIYHSERSLEYP